MPATTEGLRTGRVAPYHIHTSDTPGINVDLVKDLESPITWIPLLEGDDDEEEDIVDKAPQDLQCVLDDEELSRNTPSSSRASAEMTGIEEDNVYIVGGDASGAWNIEDLMK
ncbi:hypothetical protein C8R45DRAFT_1105395 [Mycena sanguinolenta]|nr:hypothetical protein C8R45DRAFT_1105395 [Mycena sanguinolenta]